MQCFYALTGYYSKDVNPSGRRSIVFDKRKSFSGVPMLIPCGKCIGCRMNWRAQWAVRSMHEKRMHQLSAFVTLTYSDENLPPGRSLSLRHYQNFMKTLRLARGSGLRFFGCGEYGDTTKRPHYHFLFFNTDFPDMRFLKSSTTGAPLYRSAELSGMWKFGDNFIGSVDHASCSYVTGYILKKCVDPVDYFPLENEFRTMSRRPGLGHSWFEKFSKEAYDHDSCVMDGHEVGLPRYYDTLYERVNGVGSLKSTKRQRRAAMFQYPDIENTTARSMVRERFEYLKQARFRRDGSDG
ncbi:replication initiator protein [Blackfly microvirus SF02]|uniref:Replication initiator protein n=1 Tax=Blackfly microvirus SF02 TaxID=2576452 RepID=A0A4P8PLH8_9VIRU|nr:replication initiator protein [Blackfly microvirus SF02]